ncbi:MAG: glycosyltransferase family 1 protein [bacterium]|nr:glycosyltransferase family 1 protein [bacterium]
MKKIGIDARMLGGGFGIGRYVQKLVEHLEIEDSENEYVIFLRKENWDAYSPVNDRFTKVLADIPWYSWKEQVVLPYILRSQNLDLMHFPHFNVPVLYGRPFIVTIHDLIMFHAQDSARSAVTTRHPLIHRFKHACFRFVIRNAARKSKHIIAVSHAVAKDIHSTLGVPENHIRVIYEASDPLPGADQLLPPGVQERSILYVGSCYPHKNLTTLLNVWKLLKRQKQSIQLVICGQNDVFAERFRDEIALFGLESSVIHIGPVSDASLATLYAHATALISASLQEGFGLQIIEAMRASLPVLCSRIPAFEEVAGEAAVFFDPTDARDILTKISAILSDPLLVDALVKKGVLRAACFQWKETVRCTRDLYLAL